MALMKCPKCGKEISDRGEICPYCKTWLKENHSEQQSQNPTNPDISSKDKNNNNKTSFVDKLPLPLAIVWVICVIAWILLTIGILIFPSIITTITIVIWLICLVLGGIPLIISCFQITDKKDIENAKMVFNTSAKDNESLTLDGTKIHCPTCGSTDIERVSLTAKAVDAWAWGIFGNKRNKQFKCKNCKYMW